MGEGGPPNGGERRGGNKADSAAPCWFTNGPERLFGLELVAVKAARQKSPGNHTRPVLLEVDPV